MDLSIEEGTLIYQDFCLQCHGSEGKGESGVFPPLAQSDYLMENIIQSIEGIKYGMQGEIVVNGVVYKGMMAAQGLDDEEIADVMNYILNSWGNLSTRTNYRRKGSFCRTLAPKSVMRKHLHPFSKIAFTLYLIGDHLFALDAVLRHQFFLIHRELDQEIKELEAQKKEFLKEIEKDVSAIEQLENLDSLEKFARENYLYKKEGEQIYLIEFIDSILKP